jgi:hypothetical protein
MKQPKIPKVPKMPGQTKPSHKIPKVPMPVNPKQAIQGPLGKAQGLHGKEANKMQAPKKKKAK